MSSIGTLTPAMQDYLEAIYHLQNEKQVARVKEIAKRLRVKLPSVSGALKSLRAKELVHHEDYGYVTLTAEGRRLADEISQRHEAVRRFLISILQIDATQAEIEACHLEHAVSARTLQRLLRLIEFVANCPRGGQDWLNRLADRWDDFECDGRCEDCVASIEIPTQQPCAVKAAES
ncbi:MAG: metal-dependent transcriptional regulator [Armatimonadota bacterium]